MRLFKIIFISVLSSQLIGCGVFRGIPSHGGGKRFDEEERVVAGSIRETLADMDLRELAGKKVLISLQCIAGDGGASVTFPGLSSINAGIGGNIGTGNIVQLTPDGGGASLLSDNSNKGGSGNLGVTYSPQVGYAPTVMSTQPDENYLRAALEMKARHAGLILVQADPQVTLYVLVDVLGTNRSHREDLVSNSDTLEASCQCTYYAQDAKTGRLIFQARQAKQPSAAYKETHTFGVRLPEIKRTLEPTTPTPLPVDNPQPPSTQPIESAAKKPWLNDVIDRMAGLDDSD